jgi:hypothetical protein
MPPRRGLRILLVLVSTKMPRLRRCGGRRFVVATISMAKTKNSRHGSEMGVFSEQLENPGFKVPCYFGCYF